MSTAVNSALKALVIAALATALVVLASRLTAFKDFDRYTYDTSIDHVGLSPPSRQIVLIDFDEESFQRIRQFPIPRSIVADAIRRIGAAKPRVIGIDLFLSEPRTPAEDKAMQDALTAAAVVILASQTGNGTLPPVKPLPQFCQPEIPTAASGFCAEGTPGALGYAFVNLPTDDDGFIRQANLFSAGDPPALSFPLTLAQQYAGEAIKPLDRNHAIFLGHKIPYSNSDYKTILIGSWGMEPATRIPAWKLLAGNVPDSTLADKLVLVGQSSDAARDTHFTPLFRVAGPGGVRLRMGGTSVQAAAIRSLLEGKAVQLAADPIQLISILLAALLAAVCLFHVALGRGLIRVAMLMILWCGVSLLLYSRYRYWLPFLPAEMSMAITLPLTLGLRFLDERVVSRQAHQQREQLMKLFSSYVDPAVAKTIWKRRDELSLAGEERIATVMFTDIRGFTALSAHQPPAVVLGWLNRYLEAMDEVIREHGGFLNKFIGDGLMIIFGLPLSQGPREDAHRALDASVAMLARVDLLNRQRLNVDQPGHPGVPLLRIGIGIHTGRLMAGSIGSPSRQEYSVIGETVNLASRLESLNKPFHTEILMSAATKELVDDVYPGIESLGPAKVAGLEEPVPVYTLRVQHDAGQQHFRQEHIQEHTQEPQT